MKVWITKYALTVGVIEKEVEQDDEMPNMVKSIHIEDRWQPYFHRPHWWPTEESAILRAEQMRNAKIKSLEKQIEKLKKLKFEI